MKTRLATGAVALVLTAFGCQNRAPRFTAEDAAAIRTIFDSVVTDIRAGRWDAWAAHFADDARFHPSNGRALRGRAAILAWGKSFPPFETFSFGTPEVAGDGNLAYGSSSVIVKIRDVPADTAKQLVVFRRDAGGRWWVQVVSVTSDLPLPIGLLDRERTHQPSRNQRGLK